MRSHAQRAVKTRKQRLQGRWRCCLSRFSMRPPTTRPRPVHACAGPRSCPGGPLIAGLLPLMQAKLVGCPRFCPERGHASSGRHNDANWSGSESAYFAKTVGRLLASKP